MKKLYSFFCIIIAANLSVSQTVDQIKADRQTYIWGEGTGTTLNRADQDALGDLISQISVQVESRFTLLREETTGAGKDSFKETYRGVINTYSSATLRNTERLVISNEPDARVFRYIKRADIDKIFAERARKINGFTQNALHSSTSGRVSDALRYFYWAHTLLRSHPEASSLTFTDDNGREHLLKTWLPMQINSIFADLSLGVSQGKKDGEITTYLLSVKYKGSLARNFDYSYWTGRDWTNLYSAKDGIGVVEFIGNTDVNEIRLRAEYVFEGETAVDNELRDVMSKLDIVPFRNSYISLRVGEMAPPPIPKVAVRSVIAPVADPKPYEETMQKLMRSIRSGNHNEAKNLFTPEGYQTYQKLLQYGQARIVREPDFRFIQFENGVICRSLPMSFNFRNNTRNFVEDVVFYFDNNKKISNITMGLAQSALSDIIENDFWSERVRLVLINFLENYKTAYALKRADYIESIFADDALIIVGSVLRTKTTGDNPYLNNQIVRYNRYTKEQFIRNLRHSFASNEFINIRFEDNIIRKSGRGGEVYGIQIKQDYFSSNYGDSGYLFLLVDINDPDQPIIHVRTWQPEKNPDGSIYGLGDF